MHQWQQTFWVWEFPPESLAWWSIYLTFNQVALLCLDLLKTLKWPPLQGGLGGCLIYPNPMGDCFDHNGYRKSIPFGKLNETQTSTTCPLVDMFDVVCCPCVCVFNYRVKSNDKYTHTSKTVSGMIPTEAYQSKSKLDNYVGKWQLCEHVNRIRRTNITPFYCLCQCDWPQLSCQ
jgi:hypothetical protein